MSRTHAPKRIGLIWRLLAWLAPARSANAAACNPHSTDPASSSVRMRVRFSERLRDLFRPSWLRAAPVDDSRGDAVHPSDDANA